MAAEEWSPQVRRVSGGGTEGLAYALMLLKERNFKEAKEEFEKALASDPNSFQAHLSLGICHQGMRQFRDAPMPEFRSPRRRPNGRGSC